MGDLEVVFVAAAKKRVYHLDSKKNPTNAMNHVRFVEGRKDGIVFFFLTSNKDDDNNASTQ